ncbi:hypothetical protein ANANG_G00002630 [Anguilla anguilla]|uniref:Uncharacterized protein n=1 Tax=Anguilla anguilla TaxID=7936 RepID=A0A9D3MYC2_ANGAN|nr:hypothetical protein ANANG_G00002630 [Anguilla anguilla]
MLPVRSLAHTEHVQQKALPTQLPALGSQGWRRYYGKYIDVRRGGVGGVAMLLAGLLCAELPLELPPPEAGPLEEVPLASEAEMDP